MIKNKKLEYKEWIKEGNQAIIMGVMTKAGQRNVTQILVGDVALGGYRELTAAMSNGEFAKLVGKG